MIDHDEVLGLPPEVSQKIGDIDAKLFEMLADFNLVKDFSAFFIKRAELLTRQLPMCQTERQATLIAGATMICYELADNASLAQARINADASAENLARIRGLYSSPVEENAPDESLG